MSCLSCLVHSHMLVPAVTFSPQAPRSADPLGTAEVSAPLGKVSEWIVLAFRCTVRFLPEAALLKLCSRVNLPDPAPSCCFVDRDLGTSCVNSHLAKLSKKRNVLILLDVLQKGGAAPPPNPPADFFWAASEQANLCKT